jgi:large subunit ribosomal protein L3
MDKVMINGILGKKIGMTQIYSKTGAVVPVTVIEAGPCVVLQVKTKEKDGYSSVQLGFGTKKEKNTNKPQMGRFKQAKVSPVAFTKEILTDNTNGIKVADSLAVDMFAAGEYVDVTATTIGRGFQGGIKRWNWHRGPMSHGSMSHRAPGSIGVTDPPRVLKGKNMPGHMGNKRFTVQGLEVIDLDKENNLLMLKGAVPGAKKNYLVINKSKRKKQRQEKADTGQVKKINPLKQSKKMMKK